MSPRHLPKLVSSSVHMEPSSASKVTSGAWAAWWGKNDGAVTPVRDGQAVLNRPLFWRSGA